MKNARIMVNQPLGGVQGSFVDVRLQAAEQSRNIKVAREILHLASGKPRDDVAELLDREFFMCAWFACCMERLTHLSRSLTPLSAMQPRRRRSSLASSMRCCEQQLQ